MAGHQRNLQELNQPKLLTASKNSDDLNIQKDHELMTINLQKYGITNVDKLSTMGFFTLVDQMESEQLQREAKTRNKPK